jgi:hypothetical protein
VEISLFGIFVRSFSISATIFSLTFGPIILRSPLSMAEGATIIKPVKCIGTHVAGQHSRELAREKHLKRAGSVRSRPYGVATLRTVASFPAIFEAARRTIAKRSISRNRTEATSLAKSFENARPAAVGDQYPRSHRFHGPTPQKEALSASRVSGRIDFDQESI